MELYLDSANIDEIKKASELGFIYGLTTTPTFMHRDGITDIDGTILELSKMLPVIQIEALGNNSAEIMQEAERLLALGLDKDKTVFKIPISMEGAKACRQLVNKGYQVNLHLIYTLQQAYIAMSAGATYICPLVGRLQDQGHDALGLIEQCMNAVERYNYSSKIMFSSVRHPEHVKNALNLGCSACTIPWKVMKNLAQNHFTDIGTQQFVEHTRLMTLKVRDVIRDAACTININSTILDALVEMTKSKTGAITIIDEEEKIRGVFTDGDLRRMIEANGEGILGRSLEDLKTKPPITIQADQLLYESSAIFKERKVDTLVVVDSGKAIGMLDIQDLWES